MIPIMLCYWVNRARGLLQSLVLDRRGRGRHSISRLALA